MRVFGIDCGTECTGYGVVEVEETPRAPRLRALAAGGIVLSKKETLPMRLARVYAELTALITMQSRRSN
jgi:crossover junction endodeoxyribonuclease RuvC